MRAWAELRERVEELGLTRLEREIAKHLIEGVHSRDIARKMDISQTEVKLYAAHLLYVLSKQPPDASLGVKPSGQPPRKPAGSGAAFTLPE